VEYGGSLNGEATYELSLQSAGQLIFTADTTDAPGGGV
ncbi:MAG TPA: phage major tail protein, TP901-1 family, partial [Sulfitobacter sp.]|nr:phage major tail protein, TP901-1 family [Sulfitobacter sp.]